LRLLTLTIVLVLGFMLPYNTNSRPLWWFPQWIMFVCNISGWSSSFCCVFTHACKLLISYAYWDSMCFINTFQNRCLLLYGHNLYCCFNPTIYYDLWHTISLLRLGINACLLIYVYFLFKNMQIAFVSDTLSSQVDVSPWSHC
jgi:hypothetical protein